jgi:hypothetical protein
MLSTKGWRYYWLAYFIIIFSFIIEGGSSVFLFGYYSHKQKPFYPEATATGFLIRKALGVRSDNIFEADNPEMFRPDAVLGYTTNPGIYRIIETSGARKHGYSVTVTEPGVRATSYHSTTSSRRIYILGNSSIWAVGLSDEMTAPWLLQARLPNYQVVNLALTGYTNVHQLLQYRRIKETLHSDDIVVVSYSAGDLLHNVADPNWLKAESHGYELSLSNKVNFREVRIPYANLSNEGNLGINYIPMVCARNEKSKCSHDIPVAKVREAMAIKIIEEILQDGKCHVLVAFFDGDDNDPVIASLRSSGAAIADLRIKPGVDDDDYLPERDHRGAFTSYWFFEVLFDAFSKNKMLRNYD